PERGEDRTTADGLHVAGNLARGQQAVEELAGYGCEVSLFIDADARQIEAARDDGAPVIELHTGHYADASGAEHDRELVRIREGVAYAHKLGLVVNAGHGLHYHNVEPIAAIPGINELNIGHAIIARALFSGLAAAVT